MPMSSPCPDQKYPWHAMDSVCMRGRHSSRRSGLVHRVGRKSRWEYARLIHRTHATCAFLDGKMRWRLLFGILPAHAEMGNSFYMQAFAMHKKSTSCFF